MNFLFYMSPITFLNWDTHHAYAVQHWCENFHKALGDDSKTVVVTSVEIVNFIHQSSDLHLPGGCEIVAFSQKELLDNFRYSGFDSNLEWYRDDKNTEHGLYLAKLLASRLQSFVPDVVFALSPVPFLREMFPAARFYQIELSLFSRAPFPVTYYCDFLGRVQKAFNSVNSSVINKLRLSDLWRNRIENLRNAICHYYSAIKTIDEFMQKIRKNYERVFILALGAEPYYTQHADMPYEGNYQFVQHVMESVSSDVAVIITQHPASCIPLWNQSISDLQRTYHNCFFETDLLNIPNPTQVMTVYVDGVITLSSAAGLFAVLCGKYFVSIGCNYFSGIADCTDLEDFGSMLTRSPKNRDSFLYWTITHYALPNDLYPEVFVGFLCNMSEISSLTVDEQIKKWRPITDEDYLWNKIYQPVVDQLNSSKYLLPTGINLSSPSLLRAKYDEICDVCNKVDGSCIMFALWSFSIIVRKIYKKIKSII